MHKYDEIEQIDLNFQEKFPQKIERFYFLFERIYFFSSI